MFVLAAHPVGAADDGDIHLTVHMDAQGTAKPVSNTLLFGLAVLMLEQQGIIDETMAKILDDGIPSEADVIARINLLIKEDHNNVPA